MRSENHKQKQLQSQQQKMFILFVFIAVASAVQYAVAPQSEYLSMTVLLDKCIQFGKQYSIAKKKDATTVTVEHYPEAGCKGTKTTEELKLESKVTGKNVTFESKLPSHVAYVEQSPTEKGCKTPFNLTPMIYTDNCFTMNGNYFKLTVNATHLNIDQFTDAKCTTKSNVTKDIFQCSKCVASDKSSNKNVCGAFKEPAESGAPTVNPSNNGTNGTKPSNGSSITSIVLLALTICFFLF